MLMFSVPNKSRSLSSVPSPLFISAPCVVPIIACYLRDVWFARQSIPALPLEFVTLHYNVRTLQKCRLTIPSCTINRLAAGFNPLSNIAFILKGVSYLRLYENLYRMKNGVVDYVNYCFFMLTLPLYHEVLPSYIFYPSS